MEFSTQQTSEGVRIIKLTGRMDMAGTQAIDLRFTSTAVSEKGQVAVDLSDVSFLASIGMRTLVSSARALMGRGGAMALVNPRGLVREALLAAGIDSLIPIYTDLDQASAALLAA
ncbi:MAG: STAS domain-containing protein [Panacagrimonas sp.]